MQIVTWFAIRVKRGNEDYATMNEIARALGMSPSSHLTRILGEMMLEGILTMRGVRKPGRWFGYEYMLDTSTYERPRPRSVNLKVNGRPEGQLELFK